MVEYGEELVSETEWWDDLQKFKFDILGNDALGELPKHMDKVYKHKKLNPFVKDKEIIKSLLHEIHPAFIRKELQNLLKGKRVDASSDLKKFYYLLYKVVQDYQLSKKFIPEKKGEG